MDQRPTITTDQIAVLAAAAGIDVQLHNQSGCAEALNSLRNGVSAKIKLFAPDVAPAIRMDARWRTGS